MTSLSERWNSERCNERNAPEDHALYRGTKALAQTEADSVFPNRKPYAAGNEKTWWAFTSTTTDLQIAQRFIKVAGGTLFVLCGSPWDYDISLFSDFPEEKEILVEQREG